MNGAEDGGGGRMAAWAARAQAGWQRGKCEQRGRYGERRTGRRQAAWLQPGNQSSHGVLLIIHTRVRVREGV